MDTKLHTGHAFKMLTGQPHCSLIPPRLDPIRTLALQTDPPWVYNQPRVGPMKQPYPTQTRSTKTEGFHQMATVKSKIRCIWHTWYTKGCAAIHMHGGCVMSVSRMICIALNAIRYHSIVASSSQAAEGMLSRVLLLGNHERPAGTPQHY